MFANAQCSVLCPVMSSVFDAALHAHVQDLENNPEMLCFSSPASEEDNAIGTGKELHANKEGSAPLESQGNVTFS